MGQGLCSVVLLFSSAGTFEKSISWLFSLTTPSYLTSSLLVFSSCERSCLLAGAKSLIETVVSCPFYNFMCAYWGLAWRSSASSANVLYSLILTCFLTNIFPGSLNQVGTTCPLVDFLWNLKNRSWGVAFVLVHNNVLIECNASGSTNSHCLSLRFQELKVKFTVFHMMPL